MVVAVCARHWRKQEHGLIDNWLRHISDVQRKHNHALREINSHQEKIDRLCELNVIEQVFNVCQTTIVQAAWWRSQPLSVHGWIYSLNDGLLRDLNVTVSSLTTMEKVYNAAIEK